MKDETYVRITGITAIAAMEIAAMVTLHIDGAMLSTVVGVIAGLVGYSYGRTKS